MRIFLIFMFSLFLFGCGAEEKYPESFGEILRYQVGDKISNSEIEEMGFAKSKRDRDSGITLYDKRDSNAVNAGFWLEAFAVTPNNTIEATAFRYYTDNENVLDEQISELKRYVKDEWNADFQLIREQGTSMLYLAEMKESPDTAAAMLSIGSEGPFYNITIGFMTERAKTEMGF